MTKTSISSPVSAQMRDAARIFAAQIETGFFSELTEAQRCNLRGLPMNLAGWADLVETMEQERLPKLSRHPRVGRSWSVFTILRILRPMGELIRAGR